MCIYSFPCIYRRKYVISPQEARGLMESNERLLVVDVREEPEFCRQKHIRYADQQFFRQHDA